MGLLKWLFNVRGGAEATDKNDVSTPVQGRSAEDALKPQASQAKDVPAKYRRIFEGMMEDSTLSSATEQFANELNSNPIAILTAFLDWDEKEFDFSHNNFIFAIYDRWTPLSAQCIWRAHMRSSWSFSSDNSNSILARVLREAVNKGDGSIVEDIGKATPAGQEGHLRKTLEMASG